MKRVFGVVLAAVVSFALGGCMTLQGRATQFHVLDASPKSFVVVPEPAQSGSLEFKSYADLVRSELIARGWRDAGRFDDAEVAVFLQYAISAGRQVTFSYPIFGQVPTGNSFTYGTVSTFGNTATYNAMTTQQSTVGVVGTGVGNRVEFDRAVRVTMYSVPAYLRTKAMERLYEGEIRSTGSTGDLPVVMPHLVRGLFEEFPGRSGSTRTVTLTISP